VDHKTGQYTNNIPSPTGIASDPALAGYGVQQAEQLAAHLVTLNPPIERFYSSPFYRWYVILKSIRSRASAFDYILVQEYRKLTSQTASKL